MRAAFGKGGTDKANDFVGLNSPTGCNQKWSRRLRNKTLNCNGRMQTFDKVGNEGDIVGQWKQREAFGKFCILTGKTRTTQNLQLMKFYAVDLPTRGFKGLLQLTFATFARQTQIKCTPTCIPRKWSWRTAWAEVATSWPRPICRSTSSLTDSMPNSTMTKVWRLRCSR